MRGLVPLTPRQSHRVSFSQLNEKKDWNGVTFTQTKNQQINKHQSKKEQTADQLTLQVEHEDAGSRLDRHADEGRGRHARHALPVLLWLRPEAARVAKVTVVTGDAAPRVARRGVHLVS